MEVPKSLDSLFKEKLFRVPDYQRGYAWQPEQFKDFWEDLVNLSDGRSHYTGVLTLQEIPSAEIEESEMEHWLVEDHSYRLYHIVDGQQRLTTFVVFLQAFVDFVKALPEHAGEENDAVYVSENLSVADVQNRFLFKTKPRGDRFRTYKFGYTTDNPSHDYLRYRILGEPGAGFVQETFYTLNLGNALRYFSEQLAGLHAQEGPAGLLAIYKKLTKRFLFNEYVIKEEFDVFVAFETMNNRGKRLSALELLKNRLIYLTTLYDDQELDPADRKSLRDAVNGAWKEVYHQLGRNKTEPLNDDDFLRAHWTMFFRYSRQTSQDYISFLLNERFTPQKVREKAELDVALEVPRERSAEADFENPQDEDGAAAEEPKAASASKLRPTEIRDFVDSLKESAFYWFASFFPRMAEGMSEDERLWVERLNRLGMAYFRPLVMAILKNVRDESERIEAFTQIERFVFIAFRMNAMRSNYRSSVYYNAARALDRGEIGLEDTARMLREDLSYTFNEDGSLRANDFHNVLYKRFQSGEGYYGWSGLRYLLYEYEHDLLAESRQKKVGWDDLQRPGKDRISVEHVYPQTETEEWAAAFGSVDPEKRRHYKASLGNLLLLSASINSSLQNDGFAEKKAAKHDPNDNKLRNGYSDGSHSEIEVSRLEKWGPDQIRERGLRLLRFVEKRWDFALRDAEREELLFLGRAKEPRDTR